MNFYEYDLFIPVSPSRPQRPVSLVLKIAKNQIVEFFGGLTESTPSNKGLWRIGPLTVKDKIQVWHVLSDKGRAGDRFLTSLRKRLEHELRQDLILVIRHRVTQI